MKSFGCPSRSPMRRRKLILRTPFRLSPHIFFRCRRQFSAFGPSPLLAESLQDLLLLQNREVRICRILLPISLLNEGDGVLGGADLCADRLTLLQSPTGFDRGPWRRGKPGFFHSVSGAALVHSDLVHSALSFRRICCCCRIEKSAYLGSFFR